MALNMAYLDLMGYVFVLCVFICVWVFVLLVWQLAYESNTSLIDSEDNFVELIWTAVPTLFVLVLCLLNLFYISFGVDSTIKGVIKIIGHQWYWEYEVGGEGVCYDSFMTDFINVVDKPLRLYVDSTYCLLVTSADVIHSFCLTTPVVLKIDAVPGRVNRLLFSPDRVGVFVGYCSELCGAGHAYMPVVVEVVVPYNNSIPSVSSWGWFSKIWNWFRKFF